MGKSTDMRVCVWGAGAVGKLVACSLGMAGIPVTIKVRREEQASAIRQNGLVLQRQTGESIRIPVSSTADFHAISADLIILTVKSFDTLAAAEEIASSPGKPMVLSLQNGLGNGETLAKALGDDRIFLGLTTYGATSLSDEEVAARGEGELVLGGFQGESPYSNQLWDLFSTAGWNVRIGNDMQLEVWKKALVNIGINPVTALYRVPNGEIIKQPDLMEIAVNAVKEAEGVAVAAGILPEDSAGEGVLRLLEVCRQTAANRSSMLQDAEKGRATEIDALNGRIVKLGEAYLIDTPVNRKLVQGIKSLEQ